MKSWVSAFPVTLLVLERPTVATGRVYADDVYLRTRLEELKNATLSCEYDNPSQEGLSFHEYVDFAHKFREERICGEVSNIRMDVSNGVKRIVGKVRPKPNPFFDRREAHSLFKTGMLAMAMRSFCLAGNATVPWSISSLITFDIYLGDNSELGLKIRRGRGENV